MMNSLPLLQPVCTLHNHYYYHMSSCWVLTSKSLPSSFCQNAYEKSGNRGWPSELRICERKALRKVATSMSAGHMRTSHQIWPINISPPAVWNAEDVLIELIYTMRRYFQIEMTAHRWEHHPTMRWVKLSTWIQIRNNDKIWTSSLDVYLRLRRCKHTWNGDV